MESANKAILIVILLFFNNVKAQSRHEFWTKINVTKNFTKHFDGGIDIQYRRQNGFENSESIFQYPLTSSVRLWAYYKLRHNWKIIFSPIAYFDNKVAKTAIKEIRTATELRTMIGAAKDAAFNKLSVKNRILYEVATIKSTGSQRSIRHRYRFQNAYIFPLIKFGEITKLNFGITNEVFFKTVSGNTAFDQDRIYYGYQWRTLKTDFNIGYQHTIQKEGNAFINKSQLLLTTNISL